MKVSIVIPAYNEEAWLPACLDAIKKEIDLSTHEVETIVVDNASTDHTAEVARAYSWAQVVYEPRKGMVRARQAGYLASTGHLIANIDADTLMPQGWLQKVVQEFESEANLAALSGPYVYYDLSLAHRVATRIWYYFGYLAHLVNHHVFGVGAMLQGGNFVLRRTHLEKIGGFDTTIEFYGEDTDIARRICRVGKVKWSFDLPMYTSGRRLQQEGVLVTAFKYALNHVYTLVSGKPFSVAYTDVRKQDHLPRP